MKMVDNHWEQFFGISIFVILAPKKPKNFRHCTDDKIKIKKFGHSSTLIFRRNSHQIKVLALYVLCTVGVKLYFEF